MCNKRKSVGLIKLQPKILWKLRHIRMLPWEVNSVNSLTAIEATDQKRTGRFRADAFPQIVGFGIREIEVRRLEYLARFLGEFRVPTHSPSPLNELPVI